MGTALMSNCTHYEHCANIQLHTLWALRKYSIAHITGTALEKKNSTCSTASGLVHPFIVSSDLMVTYPVYTVKYHFVNMSASMYISQDPVQ